MKRTIIKRVIISVVLAVPWAYLSYGYLLASAFSGSSSPIVEYTLGFPALASFALLGILELATYSNISVRSDLLSVVMPFIIAAGCIYFFLWILGKRSRNNA